MLAPNLLNTLGSIVADTSSAQGFSYANPASPVIRALAKQGLVEINDTVKMPNDVNKCAVRATEAGATEVRGSAPPAPVFAPSASTTPAIAPSVPTASTRATGKGSRGPRVQPVITYAEGARISVLPEASGRGRKAGTQSETYGFSKLLPKDASGYDSFFVAATDEMPNPIKTLKPVVFSANKRYKERGLPNSFAVRPELMVDGETLAGARVFRVD